MSIIFSSRSTVAKSVGFLSTVCKIRKWTIFSRNDFQHLDVFARQSSWTPTSRRTGCIGVKLGMQPMWKKDGQRIAVTLIRIQECHVVQVKTKEVDGYTALQLGAVNYVKMKNVS
ncbi:large ribosomal subunit protein uL3-like [Corticium candelabrum]|uniref:large ribosomal subunit protein uL3-like n=1 Tax=Corticium candelabrum TaxID=121492 RepID=UPI002E26FA8F|nr:large ribosomal subunit protein uL3-like [Corticium candelabrum]